MSDAPDPHDPHRRGLGHHVVHMPRWHKALLGVAVLMLGVGAVGQLTGIASHPSPAPVSQHPVDAPADDRSHFVTDAQRPAEPSAPVAEAQQQPGLRERFSPALTRVGLSFVIGFVLGWVFRTFLKLMSLIGLLAIAILVALSYFHVLNIDLTVAREQYATTMAWATGQAQHLGGAILGHLPGSTSSLIGFFIGFRRR